MLLHVEIRRRNQEQWLVEILLEPGRSGKRV